MNHPMASSKFWRIIYAYFMQPDPLAQAITLARAGQTIEARKLLLQIVRIDPANETAWMWLVQVLPNTDQRIAALEQWLKTNPQSEKARQGLERLRPGSGYPVQPVVPFAQPADTQLPQLRPVPRFIASSLPAEPSPLPAETRSPQVSPSESRLHSPLVLGKPAEEETPVIKKTGLADLFRRKLKTPEGTDSEIDLGIASGSEENDHKSAVARVFTTDIDGVDVKPAMESENVKDKAESAEKENNEASVLDQLRGKAGKQNSSRRSFTTRTFIRTFLFLFYLTVFVAVGYYGWNRYGSAILASIIGGQNRQQIETLDQLAGTEVAATKEPDPTPSLEITAEAAPTDTPVPVIGERPAADVGLIVYSAKSPEGDLDLFTIPPEGGTARNWTSDNVGDERDPSLSADGRLIYSLNDTELYQIDAQGWMRKLTQDGAGNREPTWSPDSTRIAYVSVRDGNPEIYVMNADGSDPIRLTDQAGSDISPAWSPDGTRLAFASERDGPLEIYTMNSDGSGIIRLTYDLGENTAPDWSPDGRWIVFSGNRSGDHEIYTVTPDGTQQNRITFSPGADEHPVWSPDGYWILFTSERTRAGLPNLYAMVRDGSRPFTYFEAPSSGFLTPAWSRK